MRTGSQNASEIHFEPQPAPRVAYEPKCCEFCPRTFVRKVGSKDKLCRRCHGMFQLETEKISPLNPVNELRLGRKGAAAH